MKTETVTIQVQRFTDDDFNGACEPCPFYAKGECGFSYDRGESLYPGPDCPIWNKEARTNREGKECMGPGCIYCDEDESLMENENE